MIAQDKVAEQVVRIGEMIRLDTSEIERVYDSGGPPIRVLMMALLRGQPHLAPERLLHNSLRYPSSANEQYHALRLLEVNVKLRGADKVDQLLQSARNGSSFSADSDRTELLNEIERIVAEQA